MDKTGGAKPSQSTDMVMKSRGRVYIRELLFIKHLGCSLSRKIQSPEKTDGGGQDTIMYTRLLTIFARRRFLYKR